jgi:hypothetical protein
MTMKSFDLMNQRLEPSSLNTYKIKVSCTKEISQLGTYIFFKFKGQSEY